LVIAIFQPLPATYLISQIRPKSAAALSADAQHSVNRQV